MMSTDMSQEGYQTLPFFLTFFYYFTFPGFPFILISVNCKREKLCVLKCSCYFYPNHMHTSLLIDKDLFETKISLVSCVLFMRCLIWRAFYFYFLFFLFELSLNPKWLKIQFRIIFFSVFFSSSSFFSSFLLFFLLLPPLFFLLPFS